MKIASFAGAALVAFAIAVPARGEDRKAAPVEMPSPVASPWTGFYLGVGGGVRSARTELMTALLTVRTISGGQNVVSTSEGGSGTVQGSTSRVSPYAGFNWQIAPQWVAGIEADAGIGRQTATLSGFPFSPGFGSTGDAGDSQSVKATWDGSLRGRLGLLLTPVTMAYATGGVAMQHFEVTSTCGFASCASKTFNFPVVTRTTNNAGWTLGGGIEVALWSHWLARAEYRYADFGSQPFSVSRRQFGVPFTFIEDSFNAAMRTQTLNFGIAYTFN